MNLMEEFSAALAAMMIDEELRWRLDRLPPIEQCSQVEKAIRDEARRRGIGVCPEADILVARVRYRAALPA